METGRAIHGNFLQVGGGPRRDETGKNGTMKLSSIDKTKYPWMRIPHEMACIIYGLDQPIIPEQKKMIPRFWLSSKLRQIMIH